MTIKEFFEYMESRKCYREFIVRLAYKYADEKIWTITNEHLEYDHQYGMWKWLNDWDEGQDDVYVLGYIAVNDITEMTKRWRLQ